MKVYDLRCEHEHRFEGWFASEADFMSQNARHLIDCPLCGNHVISRLPSSPRLNLSGAVSDPAVSTPATQKQMQEQLLTIMRAVVANTEDVGDTFAEEARRMHYKETAERAIRGVTTEQERAELADEGIDVLALPLPHAAKQTLQ